MKRTTLTRRRMLPWIPAATGIDLLLGEFLSATRRVVRIQRTRGDRSARIVISATPTNDATSGSTMPLPVSARAFGMVGVFDIDWLTKPGFSRMLDTMAASPGAFHAVRVFGALSSGRTERMLPEEGGVVWPDVYADIDFSATFDALAALTSRDLVPWVVLGFFPSAVSESTIAPPADVDNWRRLVHTFFEQLVSDPRFGAEAIRGWWFEVWNEPNDARFWLGTFSQYLDLYRATSEVVDELDLPIRLGGPAIAYDQPGRPLAVGAAPMETFLRILRDEPTVRCDFVSFHRKGTIGEDEPDLQRLVDAARATADMMLAIDPERLHGLPVINNEADMKLGFEQPYQPRMDAAFPAWLGAVMVAYTKLNEEYRETDLRFSAASDNANLQLVESPFDGRRSVMTLASTTSDRDLIKLPVFHFYELLRFIGSRRAPLLAGAADCYPTTDLFHLTTVDEHQLASLFAVYPPEKNTAWTVDYTVRYIPWARVNIAWFRIDATHSNAFAAAGGTTLQPFSTFDATRLAQVRAAQELELERPIEHDVNVEAGNYRSRFELAPGSLSLLWITPVSNVRPTAPEWLEVAREDGNVVLRWTPCSDDEFFSFEVFRIGADRTRTRVSPAVLRSAMWTDASVSPGRWTYGVHAISASGIVSDPLESDIVMID